MFHHYLIHVYMYMCIVSGHGRYIVSDGFRFHTLSIPLIMAHVMNSFIHLYIQVYGGCAVRVTHHLAHTLA